MCDVQSILDESLPIGGEVKIENEAPHHRLIYRDNRDQSISSASVRYRAMHFSSAELSDEIDYFLSYCLGAQLFSSEITHIACGVLFFN